MSLRLQTFKGREAAAIVDTAAALRIRVFRDWPYLYDGDLGYERDYLQRYVQCPQAMIALAYDGEAAVGATTGLPLMAAAADMQTPFIANGLDLAEYFYCGESVVLDEARGRGLGHQFFDLREAQARQLGSRYSVFCAVDRPADHPARPPHYRPNDAFWTKRGYQRRPEWQCQFSWKDVGDDDDTQKRLTYWLRTL
jgi:GNAT superfamily N-acetyltransferase